MRLPQPTVLCMGQAHADCGHFCQLAGLQTRGGRVIIVLQGTPTHNSSIT